MSLKQEFFTNNFSSFIIENSLFFSENKEKFVKNFYEYVFKLTKRKLPKKEIEKFYDNLFLNPIFNKKNIIPSKDLTLIYELNDLNIDYIPILNKLFLILANAYIKFLIKEKNSVPKLKTMTLLLDFYVKYLQLHKTIEEYGVYSIPKEIKEIYQNKKTLNLFTIYKGIPIAHKTKILSVNEKENFITVSANRYQLIAAKFHKEIFLLENDKEYSFRANIKEIFPYEKKMCLDNIEKVQRNAPKRNFIRVQPKQKIEVLLKTQNVKLKTVLYDISLKGLCVLGKLSSFKVSDIVTVEFVLKLEKPYLINTQGEIKSITKLDKNTFRYHIYFELPTHYEYVLSKYITQREKEIVKELNDYISKEFILLSE